MHVILLSIPGLRDQDLAQMPNLSRLVASRDRAPLVPSFPAVTCPVQCNMTTGCLPNEHGVVANGFYWRERGEVEMWTAWNNVIERPQIWDRLHEHDSALTSAVWFPLLAKGCGADYVCTPAPIHNPDGSESLWCYTKPQLLYGELRDELGHFPLKHFWGPLAGIQGTAWIVGSATFAARRFQPNFFYIYLPHLDYAAQKAGPDSGAAMTALSELDIELGKLIEGLEAAYAPVEPRWIIASEYAIVPVDHVTYPNRVLRDAGLIAIKTDSEGRELLDMAESTAWALVDHQHAHVFVKDHNEQTADRVVDLYEDEKGIKSLLRSSAKVGKITQTPKKAPDPFCGDRAGDVILVSEPNSWQAYYWWHDDAVAPPFARTVDIHRKPGYDPVELFFDPATKGIPLDASLVKGSHGAPAVSDAQKGVLLTSQRGAIDGEPLADTDLYRLVLEQFGI